MAFINKNDFSIVSYIEDYKTKHDYFECDDLIAPAISLLNKKGYKTKFCCSAHPFSIITTSHIPGELSEDDIEMLKEENPVLYIEKLDYNKENGWLDEYHYRMVSKIDKPNSFYVWFEQKYDFTSLPGNAYIDENGIYWRINELVTDNFDMVKIIYEMNKEFYEWVEKLDSLI